MKQTIVDARKIAAAGANVYRSPDDIKRIAEIEAREQLLTDIIARFIPSDYIWRDKTIKEHLQG